MFILIGICAKQKHVITHGKSVLLKIPFMEITKKKITLSIYLMERKVKNKKKTLLISCAILFDLI